MKDLNVQFSLTKARTPQTKGKCENSNKFINWLNPYDGKLESEEELIHIIEVVITGQSNQQINSGTNVAPVVLFKKEKEYLTPIGNNILLENYLNDHKRVVVPSTLLVEWKGAKYSVSKKYIGHSVDLYETNKINYSKSHYVEALKASIKNKEIDIEKMATQNLERLSRLGGK